MGILKDRISVTMSAEAQKMKQEGNDAYKKKDFSTALAKYGKAIEHDPNEITYYLNTAAVHFEMKNYTECVSTCNKAIDVGRGNRGDFTNAVKTYTEAIRRNPTDPKIYSNRAACFTKLMSFDLAIKDCDKCIELEPNFVKAYLRKAKAHQALSQASKAMAAYEKALEIDPNCSEAIDGYKACSISNNSNPEEVRKQAMNDPEVQKILNDPAMRMILEQMQSDPQAIQEHLKNPNIAEKFMKLREAGLISVAYK